MPNDPQAPRGPVRRALLCREGWFGYDEQPCWVVAETAHRYRVKPRTGMLRLTGRRNLDYEQTALVPKHAVKFVTDAR